MAALARRWAWRLLTHQAPAAIDHSRVREERYSAAQLAPQLCLRQTQHHLLQRTDLADLLRAVHLERRVLLQAAAVVGRHVTLVARNSAPS